MSLRISSYLILLLFVSSMLYVSCGGNSYGQGERLYLAHCANCHMEDGVGLAKLIPPLVKADYLKENQDLIPCIIRNGQHGKITVNGVVYDQEMPGNPYTEIQINNMINYINTAWGNSIPPVNIKETKERLKNCIES